MSFLSTATGVAVIDARTRSGTITLPLTSQIPNRYFQIKDLYGAFSRSSLTVSTQAGETFDDGTTSKLYTDPFTFLNLYAASTTRWAILGGTQTISQTISSLNVSSITIGSGLGWLQLPPVQTVAMSTNTINADTIITNSTTSGYISAQVLYVSSILGVTIGGGTGNVTTANLTSTVGGLGQIYISTAGGGGGGITTANLVSTTANLQSAATQFVSSLTINTLTVGSGAGWLQLPPVQTIYASTTLVQGQALYAVSSYFGNTSSGTALQFNGLDGNDLNTVLAELSTGPGTQEFLVFKGSSTSDRVRVQTTGSFVVETGVSARLWPTVTSNATPAFVINTSSNVGIQTASPGATLDVAGTGRFQVVSTLASFMSTLNGSPPVTGAITNAAMVIATGSANQSFLSYDGSIWIPGTGLGAECQGLAYNGFQWIAGTEAGIFRSADGITWTATNIANATSLAAWNGSIWAIGGYYGGFFYSYDGATWFQSPTSFGNVVWQVAWGGDKFIAVGRQAVFYSYDGINWINLGNVINSGDHIYTVAYNGSYWLIGGRFGTFQFARSFDGLTWQLITAANDPRDLAWNGSIWVAATTTSQTILTSTDGITWTARTNTNYIDLGIGSVTWNGTYFYVASGGSRVNLSRSSNGITWQNLGSVPGSSSQTRGLRAALPLPLNGVQQPFGIYNSNVFIGISSPYSLLRFPGPDALYRNTAIGEISSFNTRFAQELVLFKGSTPQDRIRLQTTGEIRFEAGVPTRFFSSISSIQQIITPTFVISTNSNIGIGTALPAATLDVAGTGRFQTLSTLALNISSINGSVYSPGGGGGITTDNLQSTVGGLGQIYLSTATGGVTSIPQNLSTAAFFTSSILASTITTSSLQVNSLTIGTGTGWVNLGPLQTVAISSLQENTGSLYAANAYIGILSTASALQFNGLQANYTNTVLAEVSTGAGTQELLIFKGSSVSDRVRVQTTGDVRFETGVSARLWSNTTVPTLSNVTPAMIINASSNVGIQTASPGATLDVAGTGRFQTLSSLALNISSINGSLYSAGGGGITTANLQSTVGGLGQIYLSTATGGIATLPSTISSFSLLTSSLIASTITASNSFAISTLTSSLLVNGTTLLSWNGTNSPSLFGSGVDTFTLQTSCNAYVGGIASLAFTAKTAGYPLGRIYAVDSATSGSAISQLVFQTVASSPNNFNTSFTYTGSIQTFTVPPGVTILQVTMWGAGGSGGNNGPGGAGAFVRGTLSVTPGQTLRILVGQGGVFNSTSSTFGGGGGTTTTDGYTGAGGGRSAIQITTTASITSSSGSGSAITYTTDTAHGLQQGQPVIISGLSPSGFNGTFAVASVLSSTQFTVTSTQSGSSTGVGTIVAELVNIGGGGGGPQNAVGVNGGAATFSGTAFSAPSIYGGQGGSQTAGGAAGTGGSVPTGTAGSILQGGTGSLAGGGGGGGYYGGGGGAWTSAVGNGGGGGGSSYTSFSAFSLIVGSNSPNSANQAPATGDAAYVAGVAVGGTTNTTGGNGLIILTSIGGSITEAMRIGSNGFVGIGTASPSYQLDVAGNTRMSNAYLGTNSTLITQQFYGLFGAYNNTVLAEISTGGGTQELLVFKGSSASDRVRVQTTGAFVIETGVSPRLWSTNTAITRSNVTPALVVTTSSNVGIQTASPGATLDVAGTGRFQTLSSLALNISSINGSVYTPGGGGGGAIDYVSALTVSTTHLFASTVSTYVMNTYGVFGSAFLNNGPDDMALTSLTNMNITSLSNITISPFLDLTLNNSRSTFLDTNTFYVNSINEVRMVSPQVITDNVYVNQGLSTYSLTIYGPSTLTVQGWSYFQNTVSVPTMVANSFGLIDPSTNQTSYISLSSGTLKIGQTPLTGISPSAYVVAGKLNADQNLTSDADNTIEFVDDFDPQGWYNPSTYRFTPTIAGYYTVTYQVWFDRASVGDNQFNIQIQKNGLDTYAITQNQTLNSNVGITLNATKIIYMNGSGDYLKFNAYVGNALNTCKAQYGGNSFGSGTFFTAALITGGGGGSSGVSQIIAGSNVTIDPVGGTGAVTINASGGGGGPSGPIPFLSSFSISTGYVFSPLQLGTNATESYMAFYGTDGSYRQSVLAEETLGGGNQELLMFRGSNATDRIRLQTTGSMIFEAGVSSRVWPSVPSNATPSMLIDTSSNVGIQTATPAATLDVAGNGRFIAVSTTAVYTGGLFASLYFI